MTRSKSSRDLYKTDLERRLWAAEGQGQGPGDRGSGRKRRGWKWAFSILGGLGALGVSFWLYRRARAKRHAAESPEESPYPDDEESGVAA
ncbi:MAG: hypothetical protein HY702_05660 [Gemmatimonadetes bacterium]|nr:hypothetical protein [Gemmatimonadota bacterium]